MVTIRDIPNCIGYGADEDGNIWSLLTNWRGYGERKMKPILDKHGYMKIRITANGRGKKLSVHRLVCSAFHGLPPTPLHQVRHLNADRADNRPDNLAWGTARQNAADREFHGTGKGAENGRKGAHKLRGRYKPYCLRGHYKEGRDKCEDCRREKRNAHRVLLKELRSRA